MNKRFEKLTNGETNRQPNEQRTNKRIKEQRTIGQTDKRITK
jgi:hypothetical protein